MTEQTTPQAFFICEVCNMLVLTRIAEKHNRSSIHKANYRKAAQKIKKELAKQLQRERSERRTKRQQKKLSIQQQKRELIWLEDLKKEQAEQKLKYQAERNLKIIATIGDVAKTIDKR